MSNDSASRSTLGYSDVSDFDQLPTPFRCVATDLVSGESVVLSKGSLPIAMRATMSLPGIFTPVKTGSMVLVDGGVLDNIPGLAFWYEAGRFDLGSQGWKTHQSTSIATFFPTQVGATGLELSFDENGKARFRLMLGSF